MTGTVCAHCTHSIELEHQLVGHVAAVSTDKKVIHCLSGGGFFYHFFLQVDVNNFKPKNENFTVKEVPSVMFVNRGVRNFENFSDLNADKLKKKITELVSDDAESSAKS